MNDISNNISHRFPPESAEVLRSVSLHARALDIPFFVLGATARDIIFGALFDIPTPRATLDIDLALRVRDWGQYNRLRMRMLGTGEYAEDRRQHQRLIHVNGALIDLVPFGPLESPAGIIAWPPEQVVMMQTAGFEEALGSSIELIVGEDPECRIRVCTPAALAAMKLIAWHEKYPARKKDAQDLLFLLKEYIHAGNEGRLYAEEKELFVAVNFSFEDASPRLLGRDIRKIVASETRNALLRILRAETADDSQFRLVSDMTTAGLRDDTSMAAVLSLLNHLKGGLTAA
jgi:predicted nucleotidyltransferase